MKVTIKTGGAHDYEVRDCLDDLIKGLNAGSADRAAMDRYGDLVPNKASKEMLTASREAYDKMMHNIIGDVLEIVKESL